MKYVYYFGGEKAEGESKMKNLLGGKGANLAEMTNIGIPVPPGFTITTDVCTYFYSNNRKYPKELKTEIAEHLQRTEKIMDKKFGDKENPLLVSVRSGARASMPGMMDTILNLGLNDETVKGVIKKTGNERFAYDCYRRFVQMFGDVVLGLKPKEKDDIDPFEVIIENKKHEVKAKYDTDLTANDLKDLVSLFKKAIKEKTGQDFPTDPTTQLDMAIGAVFGSWDNERAIAYRRLNGIPDEWGTAVNVQSMVFGNSGENSGTGVAFTRDPASGENRFYGEFLMNAQGEDVVAGIRTPIPITKLKDSKPKIYEQLAGIAKKLENHYKDMQDLEFTIENDRLWMLQTRNGKRTGFAAIKIAVDMLNEKLIDEKTATMRIEPNQLNQLLRPIFDTKEKKNALTGKKMLAKGLNAGPGAATGKIVFNAPDAEAWAARGEKVILVRIETSPEDIKGMDAAVGILTSRGGMTSHAALVARQMGKVCIVGCSDLEINYKTRTLSASGKTLKEGEYISIDGTTGEVIAGEIKTKPSEVIQVLLEKTMKPSESDIFKLYDTVMKLADKYRKLKIRTNADQADQARNAIAFGAEGIGLCRTEHMFFGEPKISAMREMILASDTAGREKALVKLLPIQKKDFLGLFKEMEGKPVTVRLLDPPLHEFLPTEDKDIKKLAKEMELSEEKVRETAASLHEFNPMLGHRGCRLGVTYPEIYRVQTTAIMEACVELAKQNVKVIPEIMIPVVGIKNELKLMRKIVEDECERILKQANIKIEYHIGTMIELPRACICADAIAQYADFFSYGTNDLTQTTFGFSRDDAGKFLRDYYAKGVLDADPFATIDPEGVAELMKIGAEKGRSVKANLKIGICGEHGGEPASIGICHKLNFNYVSCSPFRVPIARLAAAQAALKA